MAAPHRPRFSSAAAPVSRPLPLWILFPLFFVAVYSSHWTLLRLPYYWDEAGYYIPAALDLFHTGALIPHSTLTNAHPPLPALLLAGWWHLCGFTVMSTRTLICIVSSAALLGVFRLARALAGTPIAAAVTLLTALYPIWFTQSTLAHADIFAAAFTLWALAFYLEPFSPTWQPGQSSAHHLNATAILFSLAALSKETAIVTPVALAVWELVRLVTERGRTKPQRPANTGPQRDHLSWAIALLLPILPLALWYVYHYAHTGYIFGNPEFLRYNATANLTPLRILLSLWHRFVHITLHMNMFVPVLAACALLLMPVLPGRRTVVTQPALLKTLLVVILGNALALSVLGGALLTRYLLPVYPIVLLLCVAVWSERLRAWPWLTALSAVAFIAAQHLNPPYSFAPEDNLTYRDMILLHEQAIHLIDARFPQATVLTAWPATTELEHPELGYTSIPIQVTPIDDFSPAQIEKAAQDPGAYDTALVFSTKWSPPAGAFNLSRANEPADRRLFDFHRDLPPAQIAALLHGDVVWQRSRHGEWAAILRFPRSMQAQLQIPPATAKPAR